MGRITPPGQSGTSAALLVGHAPTGIQATDSAQLQEAINDAGSDGVKLYVPAGIHVLDGTLVTPAQNDITIEWAPGAWLSPTAGWGLKVNDYGRHRLVNPRIRLDAGSAATRGLWVFSAQRVSIFDPVVWSFINIPAGFTGIDVDDNSYWCEIFSPKIRKDSGGLTGTFAKGIRFLNQSNAGRVWGGNIAHCDDGVFVDGSGNVESIGVSYEDCTNAMTIAEPSASGSNGGAVLTFSRLETITTALNITQTTALPNPIQPIQYGGNVTISGVTTILSNPNAIKVTGLVRPTAGEPTHHVISFLSEPVAHTNWSTYTQSSTRYLGGDRNSTGAVAGDSISYDVPLSKGVWTLSLVHTKTTDVGIYSFTVDGVALGTTVDGYAAATAATREGVQTFNVDVQATVRITMTMNAKNASSSAYKGRFSAILLTRSADRSPAG